MWEQHRAAVIATAALLVLQASLIAALVLQRAHRRRAERESKALTSRLFTAHEDERRKF
jgi:signal transduction histidine kinase